MHTGPGAVHSPVWPSTSAPVISGTRRYEGAALNSRSNPILMMCVCLLSCNRFVRGAASCSVTGIQYHGPVSTRYDTSGVPPQGGYVAKQCPVRAQWDIIRPCEPLPPPPVLARRFARGQQFEEEVAARLLALHPAALVIPGRTRAGREDATLGAMKAGRPLILGGRLPVDPAGRRVGEPDLLMAETGGPGYRPVDIKHHRCLDAGPGSWPSRCSPLDSPVAEAAELVPGFSARAHKEDLLQLAHYQRMLEACAMAAPGKRLGGIIGVDGV